MLSKYLVVDISTAPIDGVEAFVDPGDPPSNYTKAESIAKWKEETRAELIERAGLDLDLARITGVAVVFSDIAEPHVTLCRNEDEEHAALVGLSREWPLVGFNSLKFDWPMLMRRARYLGVDLTINTDRYRSQNIDVSDHLTHRGIVKAKSLSWYCKRLGWLDLCDKPLSGADESKVFQNGQWDALGASLRRDCLATRRLGTWAGLLAAERPMSPTQVETGF